MKHKSRLLIEKMKNTKRCGKWVKILQHGKRKYGDDRKGERKEIYYRAFVKTLLSFLLINELLKLI